ncbi:MULTISPECIES: type VI secretion system lipoprotein TssJ [Marinobacter]|uniref:type VI secretion system lipoprotein TssJ n=1 Tax=Marinobacter TaxID=2742 RepID=UPI001D06F6E8|nr:MULTISPECIES: type VI secretion system lipoprotein TssJ [Marinobacter]MCK7567128.1 type VI secretion system lipoprotein TssJ [Marinobacter xestospongiae]UDL04798.1 type VI secretion system lipoprotein TssJ [Marinobacter sp. CA1]
MTKTMRLVSVFAALLTLAGCVVANAIVEPYTNLHFRALGSINPDDNERASPLVVRVYELSSADGFEGADFFDLYDNAEAVLGEDLLSSTEMVLRPGRSVTHEMRLDEATTHIGVIGAFRDIENADWKLNLKANPQEYKNRDIMIDRRSITLIRD